QRKQEKKTTIKEPEEEEIISLLPKRKKEDLDSIISAIENISGEKYERTITGDSEEHVQDNADIVGDLPEDLNNLTVKELKNYCKANYINVPPKARKADIIKIIKYVLGTD
ncbi:MAG: hypothetical protein ACTSQR_02910, partial [Promethearchaeota archaeon]